MAGPPDTKAMKPQDREQLRRLEEQLISSWQQGKGADLDVLVRPVSDSLRPLFLRELIKTDLEMRYRHQCPLLLEAYLGRFPELRPAAALPPGLIFEEYRIRQEHGDHPSLTSYRERFPGQFEQVQQLVQNVRAGTLRPDEEKAPFPLWVSPLPERVDRPDAPRTPATIRTAPPRYPTVGGSDMPSNTPLVPPLPAEMRQELPVAGKYTLLHCIGRGEFGEVYRALAPGGVEVAVKRIFRPVSDETSRRERQSLELLKSLRHSYLLQTQAFWAENDRLSIVMELADGSLHDWFKECKAAGLPGIPKDQLLTFFLEAAEALDFLHSQQVIHRDVKPANLLRLKGHAKVADFGLARLFRDNLDVGTFCGTPRYMAPEVWQGQVSVNTDQYSLAISFMDMCFDRYKPGKLDLDAVRQLHTGGSIDLTGFSDAEQKVIRKALAKDPSKRYPSCMAFIQDLARASAPPPPRTADPLWRQVVPVVLCVLVGVVVILLGSLASAFRPSPIDTPEEKKACLPPGFEADPPQCGPDLPKKIVYKGLERAPSVDFLLISPNKNRKDDPPAFYIMQDKVTIEQMLAALKNPVMRKRLDELTARFPNPDLGPDPAPEVLLAFLPLPDQQKKWEDLVKQGKGRLPVMDVKSLEADCFAFLLGGHLPTGAQWDMAGGECDKQPPFQPGFKPRLRDEPLPVGSEEGNKSIYQCRDMAHNGREWTRDVFNQPYQVRFPEQIDGEQKYGLILRGVGLGSDEAFRWDMRKDAQPLHFRERRGDVGFRVVVEPR